MALIPQYRVNISGIDGVLRPFTMQFYVSEAKAKLYFAAADETARAATDVGVAMQKVINMQSGFITDRSVTLAEINDAAFTNPADTVLRGNKLEIGLKAGIKSARFSIPCRAASTFTQEVDSLNCQLDTPAAMSDMITALEAVVVDSNGTAATVSRVTVVD